MLVGLRKVDGASVLSSDIVGLGSLMDIVEGMSLVFYSVVASTSSIMEAVLQHARGSLVYGS